MVTAEAHARIVEERDNLLIIARERHEAVKTLEAALKKLENDRSTKTIQSAGRFMTFAWIMMVIVVVFTGSIIVAGAIRASARECPAQGKP